MITKISKGSNYPLGANIKSDGINFAIFSAHCQKVEICFFDQQHKQIAAFELTPTNNVWHGLFRGIKEGSYYGYRVHGEWQPQKGYYFNPHKILLDPYAKRISHQPIVDDSFYGYDRKAMDINIISTEDNSEKAVKGILTAEPYLANQNRPKIPWSKTIIYEAHVKALSQLHSSVAVSSRGKLSALKSLPLIDHFKKIGITSIQLMPIQAFSSEQSLVNRGLTNFWGYNPISFMAINPEYCELHPHKELIQVIDVLHKNNLELILDIVFNHSAESDKLGPMYSWRGIDNRSYYWLNQEHQSYDYVDISGCGNAFNSNLSATLQLIIDALEFWASFGVDGFRFDLGSILALDNNLRFDAEHHFFTMIRQNKLLSDLKMISEPWDWHGYHLGKFPVGWVEYNDLFSKKIKQATKHSDTNRSELANVIAGSDDKFSIKSRFNHRPLNYITTHDGFSLLDLVSYNNKYNEDNGQDNQDGSEVLFNDNHGHEGPSDDPNINQAREKHIKNLLLLLFFSQGIPLIRAGDELGQSFAGNNNNYCHDNESSWINWQNALEFKQVLNAVSVLGKWRKNNNQLFELQQPNTEFREILWFNHKGKPMTIEDWHLFSPSVLMVAYKMEQSASLLQINLTEFNQSYNLPKIGTGIWQLIYNSHPKHTANMINPKTIILWQLVNSK